MKKNKYNHWLKYLSIASLVLFMAAVNPYELNLLLLLVPVALFMLSTYLLIKDGLSRIRKGHSGLTNKTIAMLITFLLTVSLVMQSVGQLTSVDTILFMLIAGVMIAYLYRVNA